MPNAFERFSERLEKRAKLGGRAIYETRLQAKDWYGEGGRKLTEAEKTELGNMAYDDPTGQVFEDVLRNRQKANNMEGSKDVPQDWAVWAKKVLERRQEGGDARA